MFALLNLIYAENWLNAFIEGAFITVLIAFISMMSGFYIGLVWGVMQWYRVPILSIGLELMAVLLRIIPEILLIYLLFFGSFSLFNSIAVGLNLGQWSDLLFPFAVAFLAISFIAAAYISASVRANLNIISHGQIEAAQALGLSKSCIFWYILRPQLLRLLLPALNNIWQNVLKDTALLATIGMGELLRTATIGANSTGLPFLFYSLAAFFYLLITAFSQLAFKYLAQRLHSKAY